MTDTSLLALYGTALFAASLLGSGLPRLFRMTHTRTQMVLSLISGLMLGVALLHLIPHAFANGQSIDSVMIWTLSGLIFMLLLLRWFHFHQHDFASAAADCDLASADEHHHAHAHDHAHLPEQALGAMGLFAGLCVHTVVDGIGECRCVSGDPAAQAARCAIYRDSNGRKGLVLNQSLDSRCRLCTPMPVDRSRLLFRCVGARSLRRPVAGQLGFCGRRLYLYRVGGFVAGGTVSQPRPAPTDSTLLTGRGSRVRPGLAGARALNF